MHREEKFLVADLIFLRILRKYILIKRNRGLFMKICAGFFPPDLFDCWLHVRQIVCE